MQTHAPKSKFVDPLTIEEVTLAHADLLRVLKPPRKTGRGHKDPELDDFFKAHLEGMKQFMWTYINPKSSGTGQWKVASLKTADNLKKGQSHAKKLHSWTWAFIADHKDLPVNPYGAWNESVISRDPEITQIIHVHLQSKGKFVKAMDLVILLEIGDPESRQV